MQFFIDQFCNMIGGNLIEDSVEFLRGVILVYLDGLFLIFFGLVFVKRVFDNFVYFVRCQIEGIEISVNIIEFGVVFEGGVFIEIICVVVIGM